MAYPANIAFTFATQTGPIPLNELDANFTNLANGLNGIGNGTSALQNVNITGGTVANVTIASATGFFPSANIPALSTVTITFGDGSTQTAAPGAAVAIIGAAANVSAAIINQPSNVVTYLIDEVIVGQTLGGTVAKVGNITATLNVSTVGLNGMDVGSPPASGYLSIYAISSGNGAVGLLAANGSSVINTIYNGGHAPSGYVNSALVGIWPVNSTQLMRPGTQIGRNFSYEANTAPSIFTSVAGPTTLTSQSATAAIPPRAKTATMLLLNVAGAARLTPMFASDIGGTNAIMPSSAGASGAAPGAGCGLPVVPGSGAWVGTLTLNQSTPQTIFWAESTNATDSLYGLGFSF